ncbi:8-oxo-dGTP pyrophosphatase MutT, NUDIX family [Methylobacterium sp. 174MFSha1.1]|uniref:CoA pyrophosphatase n=1 Tax=Methylobacterium sp. 174MFSha1.1 TaxID=1502749 RepID=UPI0008E048EF|nr:CoA pyrophosphatase [Methylobacterium sp. 174MFSha1.1]SFU84363.1 8-oxo-dGTP pyrophosphatase MutT, NUDIX family [Methylobacterium sp. 174MFSha1.1]
MTDLVASTALDLFLERARARLRPEPPGPHDPTSNPTPPRGDHDLEPDVLEAALARPPRLAAVLVPVVPRDDGVSVLFTQRSAHLRDHSGQIAFPGGKIDSSDPSPLAAALREAEEEIGLDRAAVTPLGYLDPYLSGTGFLVTPVVGLVAPDATLTLNPHEVADAFEVPLAFLMDVANHALHSREWRGRQRRYYAIPFGERYIWGVTAGIVRNLYDRLHDSDEPTPR